ncbi:MAG: D-alanyl-D-alanine carboxypeptidase family protein [Eubacteriales bacterium]|nr:D-alanyl-D-alanine carboxypeptidase family protein [Eubacteriales bacterium]
MNVKKRVRELIGGIAFAIIFAVFGYWSCKVAVHSSDTANYETNAFNREYGYDRVSYLRNHGRLEEAEAAQEAYDLWMIDEGLVEPEVPETEIVPEAVPVAESAPEPTPEVIDPNSPKGRALAKGLPAPPEIDINDWQYILVNPTHELESTYEPPQLAYLNMTGDDTDIRYDYDGNRQMVDSRIAQPLVDFAQGCKAAGLPVYLSSGYRAYTEQSYLFNRKLNQGYSYDVAKTIVAYPGTSEHQTGMCCDITDYYHELKDESLAQTETYKWLSEHCTEYGFVVRYPEDKSGSADSITGVIYEPWHFRYVGVDVAKYLTENNLCLEEFWELYV